MTICTSALESVARSVATARGMPGLFEAAIAVTPHPLQSLSQDAIAARAEELLPRVEQVWRIDRAER